MKYTDEYLKTICENKNLTFISTDTMFLNNKNRKICNYVCNNHTQYGIQYKEVEKIESIKKPCVYCNHSRLDVTFQDEIDSNIELLGKYIDYNTTIPCRCKIHNEYFDGIPSVLLHGGTGCKICAYVKLWDSRGRRGTAEAKEILESVNSDLIVVGEYKGSHEFIECECKIHKNRWSSVFCNLLNRTAMCPICSLQHAVDIYRLSDEQVMKRLEKNAPHIKLIGEYKGKDYETSFYCSIHDVNFPSKPKSFLYNKSRGCPLCSASNGEKRLQSILNHEGVNIKTQYVFPDCKYINPLRFDVFDLDNKIAYEYQGEQHYRPINFGGITDEEAEEEFRLTQIRDQIKVEYCKNNNIPLIIIPYWEYNNMENYIYKEKQLIK